MRTTLTLDNEIAQQLREKAHRERKSFKETVNETLKTGLYCNGKAEFENPTFEVHSSPGGFRPGIDPVKLSRLLAEMDAEEFLENS